MAVNKNFVVKNGFEVATNLVYADSTNNRVGLGSTTPRVLLDVRGGIAATDSSVSGVSSVGQIFHVGTGGTIFSALGIGGSVGVGTATPEYLFHINSPVSTGQTALYVNGDVRITGDIFVDDINLDQLTSNYINVVGFGTINDLLVPNTASIKVGIITDLTGTNVQYSGIGTINDLYVDTASIQTGVVTTISGTNLNYSGVGTVANVTGTNLNYSGIATVGSLSIDATQVISNSRELQNIVSLDATTTATIEAAIENAPNNFTDINVAGISTLNSVLVVSGVVTAVTGIVTYYGDGSNLSGIATNLTSTIGIQSGGNVVGTGITTINVVGTGFTADSSGTQANLYLPPPGVSLGLAIALGS
jgi:hypothetical protein